MTDDRPDDDDPIRDALTAAGTQPTPEFVASLRSTLVDAAAGRTTATVSAPEPASRRWMPLLAAAAAVALVVTAVAVVATRGDDGEVATAPPATSSPTDTTAHDDTPDHPTTAEQLSAWVGIRLNGVGNGAVNGEYPWFVIESVDVDTGAVRFTGDDACNAYTSTGTIVDGRFEFLDGEITSKDCGPGVFEVRYGDAFIVREDGIDIERSGIVYPFRPDPVVEDAATMIDRRRFVDTSGERPFPFSIVFEGTNVVGFDGCGIFGATAEYEATLVRLLEVEAQCSTSATPLDSDVVEHVGSSAIRIRRDATTVFDSLVSVSESFVPPTTEWLLGDWLVGWGRVTFEEGRVTLGRCETTWESSEGLVLIAPWDGCVTGLFPGDPRAEETLRVVVEAPLVQRLLPPTDVFEQASILDSGSRSVRLVRIEEQPPASPHELFALTEVDGVLFEHDRLPTILVSGSSSGLLARGSDGCGEFSVTGAAVPSGVDVGEVRFGTPCAVELPGDRRFAPAAGTPITVDGSEVTAVDEAGRTGRYVAVGELDEALVSDLLDPTTGTGAWSVDGITLEFTGPPGVGVLRVGSCERTWAFGVDGDTTPGFGPLVVEGDPILGCAAPDSGHDAAELTRILSLTPGTGAEIRLDGVDTAYLVRDVAVVRLTRLGSIAPSPGEAALVDQLVGRTWVGVDGPWRTTSPTLLFDSLDREPGLLGVVVDNGCNRGDGTFRLDGDRMIASEIAIEEAGCDHEVAYLVDGTTLAVDDGVLTVTSTSGPTITTTYVALDSVDAIRSPDLTGDWSANGIPITIAGTEVTAAPDAPTEIIVALRSALDDEPLEALRRDDGWIVRSASGSVQLEPS
jgi:heat shock protein HslJ